ncbi:MAG: hypothetical protein WD118_09335 [Phycisphaeraceae bacterium]
MTRAVAGAVALLLLVHLLAGVGFVGWLYQSGRLDGDRAQRVVDMFELTIDEEQRQQAEADRLEVEARQQAEQVARMQSVADGPLTLQDRLASEQQADEVSLLRLERLQRETQDLRRQIDRAQTQIAREREQLEAERTEFEEALQRQADLLEDEDFQQAVSMYEQLRPRQTKQMFQQLMDEGETEIVVQYLAAMKLRTAGRVLQEFKEEDEIEQATDLIERLRQRGVNLTGQAANGAGGGT